MNDQPSVYSITWVSENLGICGSTLRSWEKRYGLVPSQRSSGSHRRYTETDIRCLERMQNLIESGMRASQAAQIVMQTAQAAVDTPQLATTQQLIDLAQQDALPQLIEEISQIIKARCLISAWEDVLRPAVVHFTNNAMSCDPGSDPSTTFASALLACMRIHAPVVSQSDADCSSQRLPLLLLTDVSGRMEAQVVATELSIHGLRAQIILDYGLGSENYMHAINECLVDEPKVTLKANDAERKLRALVLIMGNTLAHQPITQWLACDDSLLTAVLDRNLTKVEAAVDLRFFTLRGAVGELLALDSCL